MSSTNGRSPIKEAEALARTLVRARLEVDGYVKLPDVTRELVEHYLQDPDWLRRYLTEALRPLLYDVAQGVVKRTRGHIVFHEEVVKAQALGERVRKNPKFSLWTERVLDRHKRLFEMSREDLIVAAEEREKRGGIEIKTAVFFREIAKPMQSTDRVGNLWDDASLSELSKRLAITISTQIDRH